MADHDGHGPAIEHQALEDILGSVGTRTAIEDDALRHAHSKNVQEDIEHLIHAGRDIVAKKVPEAKADYRLLPSFDTISGLYKQISGGIKEVGKGVLEYSSRLKGQIAEAFERTLHENAMGKALARFQAIPLATSKKAAVALAKMNHDYHLIDPINSATSTQEVAAYVRNTLESIYAKATQLFTYKGGIGPLREAYKGAH